MRKTILTALFLLAVTANAKEYKSYLDIGYTQQKTTFENLGSLNNSEEHGFNTEFGYLRLVEGFEKLYVGSGLDLTVVNSDQPFNTSHSSFNADIFKIELGVYDIFLRAGFGVTKVFTKVNSIAWGSGFGIYYQIAGLSAGVKYRYSRLQVEKDPDIAYEPGLPDNKYITQPISFVLSFTF